ncbi:DUF6497 family protein [Pseudoroseicyclus aestuarii]|uniref:Acetolactate synthase n=1 Tax=Pseudoroseicyclus aestuarii TaxID=1795041 RepID=A0A318SYN0_9RHOB|nr:DUF6497 family protein [Pseudoroseicyclus aestuarii]PYE85476.1 hypothetical protein DFP88_101142 [Pseudoroseicyclus aestuarii]
MQAGSTVLAALAAIGCLGPAAAAQTVIDTPSGASAQLLGVVLEEDLHVARFRFLVEALGSDGLTFEAVDADFAWLCAQLALPALRQNGWEAGQVILSYSDRDLPFGTLDAEATQYFEAFRVEDGACILDPFG